MSQSLHYTGLFFNVAQPHVCTHTHKPRYNTVQKKPTSLSFVPDLQTPILSQTPADAHTETHFGRQRN